MEDNFNLVHGSSSLTSGLSNYNKWIIRKLSEYSVIRGRVFEFGCGTGGITKALSSLPEVESVIANDTSASVAAFFKSNSSRLGSNVEFLPIDIFEVSKDLRWDISITTNTLEHIHDEGPYLAEITKRASTKTSLVLVPAFQFLYGTLDKDGGHFRRYTKKTFSIMVENQGLRIEKMEYFNFPGVFGWWFNYVFMGSTNYVSNSHHFSYRLFDKVIVPFYSPLEDLLSIPLGLSLIAQVKAR